MSEEKEIINKVAASGLITIDLEEFYPHEHIYEMDIKDFLFEGIILKEKDFRKALIEFDWNQVQNKILTIFCSEDAIIPSWAFMLIVAHAQPYTNKIYVGNREQAIEQYMVQQIDTHFKPDAYSNQKMVIKGCGDKHVSEKVYMHITQLLLPVVKSLMFGEPCSTVPVYKKKP